MTLQNEVDRGVKAMELAENPIYREAIQKIRDGIFDKWRAAPIRDREGMQYLKLMDKVLTDIEMYIIEIAETGKLASIQTEQEIKQAALKSRGIHF